MKLRLSELEKRMEIALDRSIIADGVRGVMKFGTMNDYPQRMERIITGSITAKSVAGIYARFLTGAGFENDELNKIVIGRDSKNKKITLRSLLSQVALNIAYNNGAYVHLNYNYDMQVVSAKNVLFKNCRFSKLDSRGYTSKIGYYENWQKESGTKFKKEDISWYNIFNLNPEVFAEQIRKVDGIENYKGQIYFHYLDDQFLYPLSPFDAVYMDADTENEVGKFKNNEVRNGFSSKHLFQINEQLGETAKSEMAEGLYGFMGSRGDKALVVETPTDESGNIIENKSLKSTKIDTNIDTKTFENWEKDLTNKIRKAVNVPLILIDYDEGNLGTTSGEAVIQATNFYNAVTEDARTSLEEMFEEIFSNFDNDILNKNTNWKIKPLSLYGSTTITPAATGD